MSLKVGIVGLPNVGKSTLFNALLKRRVALSANYPFATVEPNIGVVAVPDPRLQKLAELTKNEERMTNSPPILPAVVEFVDIAGLVKGAATGAGLGNKFLSHIREVDAIIHVLRDFNGENIVREGSVSPVEDKLTIETELGIADIEVLEKLLMDKTLESEQIDILKRIKSELNQGFILGKFEVVEKFKNWFIKLPLISIKPVLYVYNVDENAEWRMQSEENSLKISAKLEEELADLNEEERIQYLEEIGIHETGLERLIKKAYSLLGLISFLTIGVKEVRAWTIKKDSKAPIAAGAIHTDFIKGFIRAQVVSYDKLIEAGSLAVAKAKGWVRTEGKEYIVQDGDVIEFLISS